MDILNNLFDTLIVILIWLGIFFILKIITQFIFKRKFKKRRKTLINLFLNVIQYLAFFIMIFVLLNIWQIDTNTILAGAGFLGLVFGFGAQKLINDFISGFFIIFEKQYDIDDAVLINDRMGTVENIGLKTTLLRTWNGELHIFANGEIKSIVNYSKYSSLAVVDIKISYENKIEEVEKIIAGFLNEYPFNNESMIKKPTLLGVQELSEYYYCLRIISPTKSFEHFGVQRYLRKEIKKVMEQHHIKTISLPYIKVVEK